METQNLTPAIPIDIRLEAQLIDVERYTSLSDLPTETLEETAARADAYERAQRQHLAWLDHAANLGTGGQMASTQDELHER